MASCISVFKACLVAEAGFAFCPGLAGAFLFLGLLPVQCAWEEPEGERSIAQ